MPEDHISNLGPDTNLPYWWTRQGISLQELLDLITAAAGGTGGTGGGGGVVITPTDLSNTPYQVRYTNGWPQRPVTTRPVWWIGGTTPPPNDGLLTGGGGMAGPDMWLPLHFAVGSPGEYNAQSSVLAITAARTAAGTVSTLLHAAGASPVPVAAAVSASGVVAVTALQLVGMRHANTVAAPTLGSWPTGVKSLTNLVVVDAATSSVALSGAVQYSWLNGQNGAALASDVNALTASGTPVLLAIGSPADTNLRLLTDQNANEMRISINNLVAAYGFNGICMSLAAASTASGGTTFLSEDFGTGAWQSTLWNQEKTTTGASVSVVAGRGRMNTGSIGSFGGAVTMRYKGGTPIDTELTGLVNFVSGGAALNIQARGTTDGNGATGYFLEFGPARAMTMTKTVASVSTGLSSVTKAITEGIDYRFRFRVVGTALQGRVWAASGSEPGTWDISVTDSSITAAGSVLVQAIGGAAAGGGVTFINDTFTGTDGTAWSSAWVQAQATTGASATLASGKGRMNGGSIAGYNGHIRERYSATSTNTDISGTFVFTNNAGNDPLFEVVTRTDSSLSGVNGYALDVLAGLSAATVGKTVANIYTQLGATISQGFVQGNVYGFRFRVVGSAIQARIWTGVEPTTWQVDVTDSSLAGAGYFGLSVGAGSNGGGIVDVDNVVATDGAAAGTTILEVDNLVLTDGTTQTITTVPTWNVSSVAKLFTDLKAGLGASFVIAVDQTTSDWLTALATQVSIVDTYSDTYSDTYGTPSGVTLGSLVDLVLPQVYGDAQASTSAVTTLALAKMNAVIAAGIPSSKIVLGFKVEAAVATSTPTVVLTTDAYAAAKTAQPALRGAYVVNDELQSPTAYTWVTQAGPIIRSITPVGPPVTGVWSSGASMQGSGIPAFATWRGRAVPIVTTWSDDTANNALISSQFQAGGEYGAWTGDADWSCGGIWAAPTDGAVSTWAAAATGASDGFYSNLLTNLKNNWTRIGRGTVYIRFAHEHNGNWFPWSVLTAADAPNFAAAWRRFYNLKQSIFPQAKLAWAINGNSMNGFDDNTLCWPGDSYVDVYNVDWYSNHWVDCGSQVTNLTTFSGSPYGLEAHRQFASAHGKPLCIGEWGVNPAGGDPSGYIQQMFDYFKANAGSGAGQFLYENLFNIAGYQLYPEGVAGSSALHPNSATLYRTLWSSSGSPTKTSPSIALTVTAARSALGTGSGAPPPATGFVTRSGFQLMLDGAVWRPAGICLPWSMGCGAEVPGLVPNAGQIASLMASLRPKSILRYFLFQNYGWAPFDVLLNAARPYGHRFIVCLMDGNGGCGEPYGGRAREPAFYNGGWITGGFRDNWLGPVVNRYKNEPLIAWWEWSNEPNQGDANFRNNYIPGVGSYVRNTLGDKHLIGTGAMCSYISGGDPNMRALNANQYIDVCSSHTYDSNWGWLASADYPDANSSGKPCYQGEWSPQILANDSSTWGNTRASLMTTMINDIKNNYPHMAAMTWWSGAGIMRSMDINVGGCAELSAIINNPLL